jgi:hypothetical protein
LKKIFFYYLLDGDGYCKEADGYGGGEICSSSWLEENVEST